MVKRKGKPRRKNELAVDIGQYLASRRLSVRQLSEESRLSMPYLYAILNGRKEKRLSVKAILTIARAIEATSNDVLRWLTLCGHTDVAAHHVPFADFIDSISADLGRIRGEIDGVNARLRDSLIHRIIAGESPRETVDSTSC